MDHEALRITQKLIADMRAAGFTPVRYYVFGEKADSLDPATLVESGDTFTIRFDKIAAPGGYVGGVVIIPGNGEDAIHDFTWKSNDPRGQEFYDAMEAAGY